MCLASASDAPAVHGWSHGERTVPHALASQFWAFKQHWYRKECSMPAPAVAVLLGWQC